jgi:hypothetical protein
MVEDLPLPDERDGQRTVVRYLPVEHRALLAGLTPF